MGRTGPSRVGLRSAGRAPLHAPSTVLGSATFSSVLKTKPKNSTTAHVSSGKFEVLDGLLEDKGVWKTQICSQQSSQELERMKEDKSTKFEPSIALSPASKADSSVPEWRRKCPRSGQHLDAAGSKSKKQLLKAPDLFGCTLGSTASRISCTFPRSWDKPRMADAGPLDYRNFNKKEFALGTIIRAVVHEEDFTNTPKPAPPSTTIAITNAAGKEHITHGDFGAVYSENRYLIVVNNRPENHYLAVPVYSHKGNGLASKKFRNRDEYVSVADHRHLDNCQQQSTHPPLVTGFLKDGVEELLPVSVAYTSYPVSRKYGLPVAHQGRLNEESTRRLVSMYLRWGMPYEADD